MACMAPQGNVLPVFILCVSFYLGALTQVTVNIGQNQYICCTTESVPKAASFCEVRSLVGFVGFWKDGCFVVVFS